MPLPYNLQKLPPEALEVLRYFNKTTAADSKQLLEGTTLGERLIGKAIRRLVNADYLQIDGNRVYQLTTDGSLAVRQLAEYEANQAGNTPQVVETPKTKRRLTVAMPRLISAGKATDLYIGVNPPEPKDAKLAGEATVELRLGVIGGKLSANHISLAIPPDRAAQPGRISLTPDQAGKPVRVRVDAYQAFEFDAMESLGGMYFDIQVLAQGVPQDATPRAVGIDVLLKPPR